MPRQAKLKEWIGKTPDSMPPPHVRQRILERHNSTCHICSTAIDGKKRWDCDHVIPLKDGGENRESNLKPAHQPCHKKRTAEQAMERAPIERKKMKHSGAARPKGNIKSAGFSPTAKETKKSRHPALAPRRLFTPKEE